MPTGKAGKRSNDDKPKRGKKGKPSTSGRMSKPSRKRSSSDTAKRSTVAASDSTAESPRKEAAGPTAARQQNEPKSAPSTEKSERRQSSPPSFPEMAAAAMQAMRDAMPGTAALGYENDDAMGGLRFDAVKLSALQHEYGQRLSGLLSQPADATPSDSRFTAPDWQAGPGAWTAAMYELNAEFMNRMSQALHGNGKDVQRVRFAISQWVDAMSPANFLVTNPQALQSMVETEGRSLQAGMQNLIEDLGKGRISQTDEQAFEVGRDLAMTPGNVVFENELIQLIQYEPTTKQVGSIPMLMVPPCINKFYILDLQASNSVVAWLVEQGHTVFMVSWRNVQVDQGNLTWDDYLDLGAVTAINVVREICDVPAVNALGFCVGGTILATAVAALAARGEKPVQSLTLLTTLLDFEDPGILNLFVDEAHVAMREASIGEGGLMAGAELAQTFSSLRPNDLVWNYVSRNYLLGQKPSAFDLLFWNADSTNLPGPMFVWYLRHMYLQNDLSKPGRLTCLGESIDLGKIDVPTFIYGSREDHIVPSSAAYASVNLLVGDIEFVLGASGHIAGVINHPAKNKRCYWINGPDVPDVENWIDGAEEVAGSWWPHWSQWLQPNMGKQVSPPSAGGTTKYSVIEPAPGRYVRQRA